MMVIGLTGNFGTGKTTVSGILAELGAVIIEADKLGHELLQPNSQAYQEVVAAFGKAILKPNQEIERHKLGQLVFTNATALAQLNHIMHPEMYKMAQERIELYRKQGNKGVVLEAALLIEAGWAPLVDQIWVTVAPEAVIVNRLKSQRGLDKGQVLARLYSQMPSEEKIKQADVIIDTDCQLAELKTKVAKLWQELQAKLENM
ncbi:MAG TPA: dephospho-CoA kinase [Dehalococcoidia bacterium]|nr:dephospho-CoA kinase [Dehalococcoidia bacterium]